MYFISDKILLSLSFISNIERIISHSVFQNSHHGFIPLSQTSDVFYWLFPSQSNKDQDPLIIWLSGGPGCSSSIALFFENGPFKIKKDLNLEENPYSWNKEANLMYIDQPIGTGFSLSSDEELAKNQEQISQYFAQFLRKWLEEYPLFKNRNIYLTGESYAGKYISSICNHLLKNKIDGLNLKGAAIGNGLIDPPLQFSTSTQYAIENNLIDQSEKVEYDLQFQECFDDIQNKQFIDGLTTCYTPFATIINLTDKNKYDIRKKCQFEPYCYDFSSLEKYFKQEYVIKKLQVENRIWEMCNSTVKKKLLGEFLKDVKDDVISLLNENFKILLYSGNKDYVCNYQGSEKLINNLEWSQQVQFQNQTFKNVRLSNQTAGKIKTVGPLSLFIIYDSGHVKFNFIKNIQLQMVPKDQPELSLKMINDFINERQILSI